MWIYTKNTRKKYYKKNPKKVNSLIDYALLPNILNGLFPKAKAKATNVKHWKQEKTYNLYGKVWPSTEPKKEAFR